MEVYKLVQAKVSDGIFEKRDKIRFTLVWEGMQENQDLDLYLVYRNTLETSEVKILSYSRNEILEARYGGDIRKCPGEEEIVGYDWNDGIYDIWVNNYTSNLQFCDCKCFVIIDNISKSEHMRIECPFIPVSKKWWHVLQLNVEEGRISIINKLEEHFTK